MLERRDGGEFLVEEGARLQVSLLGCLVTGEELVFRILRKRSGRLTRGIEIQSPAAAGAQTHPSAQVLRRMMRPTEIGS